MEIFVNDNGVMREIVKVMCEPTAGNDQGFFYTYRDQVSDGQLILGEANPLNENQNKQISDDKTGPEISDDRIRGKKR